MTEGSKEADRFASGTGRTEERDSTRTDELKPGATGGGTAYLPDMGRTSVEEANAANAEGTIGAVGEMDITGAPAGMSTASSIGGASPTGESSGGGPGGAQQAVVAQVWARTAQAVRVLRPKTERRMRRTANKQRRLAEQE
jgi:hypothetical protein